MEYPSRTIFTLKRMVMNEQETTDKGLVLTQYEIDCLQNWRAVWEYILVQLTRDGRGWLYHATQNYRTAYPEVDIDDFIDFLTVDDRHGKTGRKKKGFLTNKVEGGLFSAYPDNYTCNAQDIYDYLCKLETIQEAFSKYCERVQKKKVPAPIHELIVPNMSVIGFAPVNKYAQDTQNTPPTDKENGYLKDQCTIRKNICQKIRETGETGLYGTCRKKIFEIIEKLVDARRKKCNLTDDEATDAKQEVMKIEISSLNRKLDDGSFLLNYEADEPIAVCVTKEKFLKATLGLAAAVEGQIIKIVNRRWTQIPELPGNNDSDTTSLLDQQSDPNSMSPDDIISEREESALCTPYVLKIESKQSGEDKGGFHIWQKHACFQLYLQIDYTNETMKELKIGLHSCVGLSVMNNDTAVVEKAITDAHAEAMSNIVKKRDKLLEKKKANDQVRKKGERLTFLSMFCPFHPDNKSPESQYNSVEVLEYLLKELLKRKDGTVVEIGENNKLIQLYWRNGKKTYIDRILPFRDTEEGTKEKHQENFGKKRETLFKSEKRGDKKQ